MAKHFETKRGRAGKQTKRKRRKGHEKEVKILVLWGQ